jgi:hypothetical protein
MRGTRSVSDFGVLSDFEIFAFIIYEISYGGKD